MIDSLKKDKSLVFRKAAKVPFVKGDLTNTVLSYFFLLWLHATLFYIFFLSYDTVQNMIGSHHTILYDEAGVYERNWWSILITSHTVAVMRLRQAGFYA